MTHVWTVGRPRCGARAGSPGRPTPLTLTTRRPPAVRASTTPLSQTPAAAGSSFASPVRQNKRSKQNSLPKAEGRGVSKRISLKMDTTCALHSLPFVDR
ncbi:hypothetical protein MRX96_025145 [Rhipicephalus microplus]